MGRERERERICCLDFGRDSPREFETPETVAKTVCLSVRCVFNALLDRLLDLFCSMLCYHYYY